MERQWSGRSQPGPSALLGGRSARCQISSHGFGRSSSRRRAHSRAAVPPSAGSVCRGPDRTCLLFQDCRSNSSEKNDPAPLGSGSQDRLTNLPPALALRAKSLFISVALKVGQIVAIVLREYFVDRGAILWRKIWRMVLDAGHGARHRCEDWIAVLGVVRP